MTHYLTKTVISIFCFSVKGHRCIGWAWAYVFRSYSKVQIFEKIYKTAFSIVKNSENAYDVAMKVIMKLIEYPSNPYLIDNHLGLLISMTKNESIDFLRKESHHINGEIMNYYAISDTGTDNLWLEDILCILTEIETEIFVEHCIWDKKLKNIAIEKEIPYITVKRRYADIKNKIDKLYK